MNNRDLGKMKKNKLYIMMFAVVMIFSLVAVLPVNVKAETKFKEAELKKIYFASWQGDWGEPKTISENAYGNTSWKYVGVYEGNTLKFKAGKDIYYVEYTSANRCLLVTLFYEGNLNGQREEDIYYTRIDGESKVDIYDIFEGEGISLIGGASNESSDKDTDIQQVTKPDKVNVKKAVNKEGNKLNVTWKAVTDADGYQVVYATDSKFTKSKKTASVSSSVYSKTISKLTINKTYYVKVRAYKLDDAGKKIYGSFSKVQKVKIDN
jgi:Fibronectin type III domain.